jgi:hypothetical protein
MINVRKKVIKKKPPATGEAGGVGYTTKVPHWLEMGRIMGI